MSLDETKSNDRGDIPFEPGHVVWVDRISVVESRPFLILNNETRGEREQTYVGVPLTLAEQANAVPIEPDDWVAGGLDEASHALPWRLQSFSHESIGRGIGAIEDEVADEIARVAQSYLVR